MPTSSGLALSSTQPCHSRGHSHLTEGLRASQQVAGPRPECRWADSGWGRGLRHPAVPRVPRPSQGQEESDHAWSPVTSGVAIAGAQEVSYSDTER